jgi:transcriptional regulator with XRE-family HTH domain
MTRTRGPPDSGLTGMTTKAEVCVYVIMDGEKIEAMRQERGLSRQEFAEEAGIAASTLRSVERAERVRRKTAWRVARVFGLHPREIGRPAKR